MPAANRDDSLIAAALAEDVGSGDITGDAVLAPHQLARAKIVAKQHCVVAGLVPAAQVFSQLDTTIHWIPQVADGAAVRAGDALATVRGNARAIVRGERLALNVLQHLSGIATMTRRCVDAVRGTGVAIVDTRKTLPGLRVWQKAAVVAGGGQNHRMGLFDRYLVKSNHVLLSGSLAAALAALRKHRRADLLLEIEVRALEEIDVALESAPDWIMLDNFAPDAIARAVQKICGKAKVEVSGGITPDTIARYAIPGVDAISVGAITHSAPAVDLHLVVEALSSPSAK